MSDEFYNYWEKRTKYLDKFEYCATDSEQEFAEDAFQAARAESAKENEILVATILATKNAEIEALRANLKVAVEALEGIRALHIRSDVHPLHHGKYAIDVAHTTLVMLKKEG